MHSRVPTTGSLSMIRIKIDELDSLDFHAPIGPQSVCVVPKLHNTSAGIEIYQLPSTLSKETFEKTEGPYRPGITKKYSNKRSGKKIAKFKIVPWPSPVLLVFTYLGCWVILSKCPCDLSDDGCSGVRESRRASPNDRPSQLHGGLG